MASGYEKMEEVSLEQLLSEGRERPATMSGNIAVPIEVDEVEELNPDSMMPIEEEPAVAVAVMDPPAPAKKPAVVAKPSADASGPALQSQLQSLKKQHRDELQKILKALTDLTAQVRSRLDS